MVGGVRLSRIFFGLLFLCSDGAKRTWVAPEAPLRSSKGEGAPSLSRWEAEQGYLESSTKASLPPREFPYSQGAKNSEYAIEVGVRLPARERSKSRVLRRVWLSLQPGELEAREDEIQIQTAARGAGSLPASHQVQCQGSYRRTLAEHHSEGAHAVNYAYSGCPATAANTGIQMHLDALKQHFGTGANSVIRAIDQLEQQQESSPRLTHGHLSKMGRAQKQVDACKKALQDEDSGWRTFVSKAKKSLQDRFVAYQDARAKKQTELKEAQDHLAFVRQEVKQVVDSLRTDVSTEESQKVWKTKLETQTDILQRSFRMSRPFRGAGILQDWWPSLGHPNKSVKPS